MAKTNGPAKIKQYSLEFKLKAVQLSDQPGVLTKDVASRTLVFESTKPKQAFRQRPLRGVLVSVRRAAQFRCMPINAVSPAAVHQT